MTHVTPATKTFYEAHVVVKYKQIWDVEASTEDEATEKFRTLASDVEFDESGGEMVSFEITSVAKL